MKKHTYIRAIYTPDKHDEEKGDHPDPEHAQSVTIVAFNGAGDIATFVDKDGKLKRAWLRQFTDCV